MQEVKNKKEKYLINFYKLKNNIFNYSSLISFWGFLFLNFGFLWLIIHYAIIDRPWDFFELPFVILLIIFSLIHLLNPFFTSLFKETIIRSKKFRTRILMGYFLEIIIFIILITPIYLMINGLYFQNTQDWSFKKIGYKFILSILSIFLGFIFFISSILSRTISPSNHIVNNKTKFSSNSKTNFSKNIFAKLSSINSKKRNIFKSDLIKILEYKKYSKLSNMKSNLVWFIISSVLLLSLYIILISINTDKKNILILLISLILILSLNASISLLFLYDLILRKKAINKNYIISSFFECINDLFSYWKIISDFKISFNYNDNNEKDRFIRFDSNFYNFGVNIYDQNIDFEYSSKINVSYDKHNKEFNTSDEYMKSFLNQTMGFLRKKYYSDFILSQDKDNLNVKGKIIFKNKDSLSRTVYSLLFLMLMSF